MEKLRYLAQFYALVELLQWPFTKAAHFTLVTIVSCIPPLALALDLKMLPRIGHVELYCWFAVAYHMVSGLYHRSVDLFGFLN